MTIDKNLLFNTLFLYSKENREVGRKVFSELGKLPSPIYINGISDHDMLPSMLDGKSALFVLFKDGQETQNINNIYEVSITIKININKALAQNIPIFICVDDYDDGVSFYELEINESKEWYQPKNIDSDEELEDSLLPKEIHDIIHSSHQKYRASSSRLSSQLSSYTTVKPALNEKTREDLKKLKDFVEKVTPEMVNVNYCDRRLLFLL